MTENEKRIVLVEDEEILANLLTQKLNKAGFTVFASLDGETGLDYILNKRPDLVLLDMMLPKLNGFSILEKMNEKGLLPKLPVIIISNSGQAVEIERARKLGVRDFLVKLNFDPDEVLEKVQTVLSSPSTEVKEKPIKAPETTNSSKQQTVLIVEDDMFIADLLGRKLHEKFNVFQASDTTQAEKVLNEQTIDLMCLDIILPGEDGYSFLGRIKASESFKNIPVLILSNLGQREEIEKGIKAGAADYLIKANMSPEEILVHVEQLLQEVTPAKAKA